MAADLPPKLRQRIYERSGGRCELFIDHGRLRGRCFRPGQEIHHMLTKARGGRILDAVGETLHLIHLCREHHRWADGTQAYEAGLLIDGYVHSSPEGRPVYFGSDRDLRRLYGPHPDAARREERAARHPAA